MDEHLKYINLHTNPLNSKIFFISETVEPSLKMVKLELDSLMSAEHKQIIFNEANQDLTQTFLMNEYLLFFVWYWNKHNI